MDSRAKQRLTGAIILVALFVLLVPELLTGPRGADAPETAADEGMRRYTIDLNANNSASPPPEVPANAPVALPQPVTPAAADAHPAGANSSNAGTLAQPGEAAAPAAATPTPAPTAAPSTTPAASQSTTPSVAAAPAAKPIPPPAVTPTPAPRTEPQKPAPATAAASGAFAVQLGSFSVRDNADRLVHDMTAKGFAAFVAPIKSGDRMIYRVRVGPTRDRAQAEALAAQLKRIGQTGAIVPIS